MLFPRGQGMAEVEALRRAWDPAMAAEIPAHITLAYPTEHPGPGALRERLRRIAEKAARFRVRLGDFRAFPPPDDGCVYIEVLDADGRFAALRLMLTAPPFSPIEFPPHLTIIHPRTSGLAPAFSRAGCVQSTKSMLMIDALCITSFENGRYTMETRFPLR
jgi:2'-5' RNA ligase